MMYNIIVRKNHGLSQLIYLTEITVGVYKLLQIHLEFSNKYCTS